MQDPQLNSSAAEADQLLADWERRSLLAVVAHARSANRCAVWDVRLGSAATALTAIVGTSIFATLQDDVSTTARVVVGCMTIVAAVSTAIHTFAALQQRKEAYERASRRHATVRRQIQMVRYRLASGEAFDLWPAITVLCEEISAAGSATPNASRRVWDRTRRHLDGDYTRWERTSRRLRGLPAPRPVGAAETIGGIRPILPSRGSEVEAGDPD